MRNAFFRAVVLGALMAALAVPAGSPAALAQQKKEEPKQQPPRQEEQFTIAVEVPLVNVDVVVTDENGNIATGLRKENFRVLEDGVPQQITNFAPTEAPITVVVLIEFRKSLWDYYAYLSTDWAYGFLSTLNKEDWVALMSFDIRPRIEVDFTQNKMEIQRHLSRMYIPTSSEANLFDAVIDVADRMQDVKGKKAVLLLASGYDTFSKKTYDDARKRLQQTDVVIFTVGVGRDFFEWLDARGAYDGAWGGAARTGYYMAENHLRTFAKATGGLAWFPRFQGELPNIFREVGAMLRNQYSLAYVPTNKARDGKFRKIKVELVGADGKPLLVPDPSRKGKNVKFVVYAREGYLAPKGAVSD